MKDITLPFFASPLKYCTYLFLNGEEVTVIWDLMWAAADWYDSLIRPS